MYFALQIVNYNLSFVQKKDINALDTASVNILHNTIIPARYLVFLHFFEIMTLYF